MVDIQNATLAGGVAMGSAADLVIHPSVAIGIGTFAGLVSVLGFSVLQPFLERTIGLHDTCGVHNLHGMPSIIGAIAAMIASAVAESPSLYDQTQLLEIFTARDTRSASTQAAYQLGFTTITLAIAVIGGLITGLVVKSIRPHTKRFFLDDENWDVPTRETPYYFDERGEIIREHGHELEHQRKSQTEGKMEKRLAALEASLKAALQDKLDKPQHTQDNNAFANATTLMLLQTLVSKVDQLAQTK